MVSSRFHLCEPALLGVKHSNRRERRLFCLVKVSNFSLQGLNRMKKLCMYCALAALLGLCSSAHVGAQGAATETKASPDAKPSDTATPKEESSVTDHTAHIGGQTIAYKATIGSILLKNAKDEPTALMYYTAYIKSGENEASKRPIAFLYNGGPGSASVWLHMGAFGPRRVHMNGAQYIPPPPYELTDNANSLLDHTDMVFIDPVGTGFSRAVGKSQDKDFWGIDEDSHSIAQFINLYVTRNGRWNSPKFLIGESYGTFRSAVLGNYLQSHDNMELNGIVLVSSVLDLGSISFLPGDDMGYVFYVPTYAATAWYHKLVPNAPDLPTFIEQARKFANTEYAAALMKGSAITQEEKAVVAKQLSHFTGLSEDYLMKGDLRIAEPQFTAELMRSKGLETGRYDTRFVGPNPDLLSEFAFEDPQSDAISPAFVSLFNVYIHDELKFNEPDRAYDPLNTTANGQWDWKRQQGFGFPGAPNAEPDLAQAIVSNPSLQVEIECGYYDLATPFAGSEYTKEHLGLRPDLTKNIQLKYYEAGHMMYVHDEDLAKLKANIAAFIDHNSRAM
jgi:carboxypeptidase C (cathepsin A)